MTKLVGSVITVSLAALAAACTQSSAPNASDATLGPGEVATVNGKRIPESIFRILYACRDAEERRRPDV